MISLNLGVTGEGIQGVTVSLQEQDQPFSNLALVARL